MLSYLGQKRRFQGLQMPESKTETKKCQRKKNDVSIYILYPNSCLWHFYYGVRTDQDQTGRPVSDTLALFNLAFLYRDTSAVNVAIPFFRVSIK